MYFGPICLCPPVMFPRKECRAAAHLRCTLISRASHSKAQFGVEPPEQEAALKHPKCDDAQRCRYRHHMSQTSFWVNYLPLFNPRALSKIASVFGSHLGKLDRPGMGATQSICVWADRRISSLGTSKKFWLRLGSSWCSPVGIIGWRHHLP